jgi:hypothetical protein
VRVDYQPGASMRRTERWLVGAVGLLRLVQLLPWLAVVAIGGWHGYRSPGLVAVLYVGYACWALLLFGHGRRRNGFSTRWHSPTSRSTYAAWWSSGRCAPPARQRRSRTGHSARLWAPQY